MIHHLLFLQVILALFAVPAVEAGIPVPERYFTLQNIDHLGATKPRDNNLWTQRYYTYGKHFKGPGHPIFLILGGEGGISPETGIMYPFVADHLAKTFGAYVLQPEHRFYGKSQPLQEIFSPQPHDKEKLFTSEQALYDAIYLLQDVQGQLKCSPDKSSPSYCPVITVGGSYPGFLSAFARMLFPDAVDMAYAASAPMGFYAQETDQYAYYNHITQVAGDTVEGCSEGVAKDLSLLNAVIVASETIGHLKQNAYDMGICKGSIPDYIFDESAAEDDDVATDPQKWSFVQELMMVIGYTFANDNMASYPPGEGTRLYRACQTFLSIHGSSTDKVREFLTERLRLTESSSSDSSSSSSSSSSSNSSSSNSSSDSRFPRSKETCWNMTHQLPTGPNATISGGDWSGDGTGPNGESWDFQTCTLLVEAIGFSHESMFPRRDWTLQWLNEHCERRFGVVPRPYELVRRFRFGENDLASSNVTRILFTNGLKDGWSVSGIKTNLSDSLIALNFENGAHHSDLSHLGPIPEDTPDIANGYKFITRLLGEWIDEVKGIGKTPSSSVRIARELRTAEELCDSSMENHQKFASGLWVSPCPNLQAFIDVYLSMMNTEDDADNVNYDEAAYADVFASAFVEGMPLEAFLEKFVDPFREARQTYQDGSLQYLVEKTVLTGDAYIHPNLSTIKVSVLIGLGDKDDEDSPHFILDVEADNTRIQSVKIKPLDDDSNNSSNGSISSNKSGEESTSLFTKADKKDNPALSEPSDTSTKNPSLPPSSESTNGPEKLAASMAARKDHFPLFHSLAVFTLILEFVAGDWF